jgi:hypothetical protein
VIRAERIIEHIDAVRDRLLDSIRNGDPEYGYSFDGQPNLSDAEVRGMVAHLDEVIQAVNSPDAPQGETEYRAWLRSEGFDVAELGR